MDHKRTSLPSLSKFGLYLNNNRPPTIINKYRRYQSLFDKPPTAIFWEGSSEEVSSSSKMKSENCNNSNSDVSSRNSSLTDGSSPFRTLNRKNLRAAVRAVKGKFRNSHNNQKMKIEVVRPSSQTKLNGEENRISSCQKELDVGLSYLQKVVNKEKLVMLPGSASIVLDTVLKLLLILNEKHLKPTSTTTKLSQHNAENSVLFTTYNEVYHSLAALLKHTDKLVINGNVDITNDRTIIASLNQNLKDSIQKLICLLGGNDDSLNQSKPILDRTCSLESHGSSASSDLCSDKEDLELLNKLDHVNNNTSAKKYERSISVQDYDPGKPPPKPPHPTMLLLQRSNQALDTGSESGTTTGSRSPPSADSGVESLNAEILSNDHHFLNIPCQDESFLSLDELFTKLNLKNSGLLNWSSSADFDVSNDGKMMLDSNSMVNFAKQQIDNQHADEQTTSEEKEELCGNTMIKTKKVTTRQVVKQTVVKTQQASFVQSTNGVDQNDDILKQLTALNDGEIKLTETEILKLKNGETLETTNAHKFPTFSVIDTTDEKINGKRFLNSSIDSTSSSSLLNPTPKYSLSARTKNRPVSDYENNKLHLDAIRSTVKVQKNMVQQSSSVQQIYRQAIVNGKLVAHDSAEKVDNSTLKASKSDTFENGSLTERKGSGSFVEESRVKRSHKLEHEQKSEDSTDGSVAYRPRKANVVSSYMRIFGSCQPENPTDFSASSLASYISIRDKWMSHEESNRKKAFTFQFSNSGKNQTPPPDKQPWMNLDKSATAPHTVSTKGGRTDYQNLMDLLDLNDRLKFPQRAIESGSIPKSLPYRQNAALTYVNYMDELDVCRYLICKKEKDDGPDIRGGPVDVLIVYATKNVGSQKGSLYQEAFLTTYRTFVCPLSLLTKLIHRYEKFTTNSGNDLEKKKVSKNTFSLLVCVVDDLSPVDLTEEVLVLINEFLFRMVSSGELNLSRYLRQRLGNRYQTKLDFNAELNRVVFSPYSPGSLRNITVLDFKSNMLAEQFTYLDWFYFKKIELSELLLWAQQQTEEHSPNLTRFTCHFNDMSYWVRTRILGCSDSKEREMIFAKFLKVMHHLRRIGNFNSLFAMLSALDSGSIRRLEWPKSLTDVLSEYTVLTESSQSFKAYRAALAETKPPCLPYIGIILQDLTFVHIGNPNMLPETQCDGRSGVINFAKRWQQYTILDNMRRFKAWPYNLKKNEQILAFLNEFENHLSEDDLWERSEKIKPRAAPAKR